MAHPNSKLTDEQRDTIVELWEVGDQTLESLGVRFNVASSSIRKLLIKRKVYKPKERLQISKTLAEFEKRARSIIWRDDPKKDHEAYNAWLARIEALESEDGGGMSHGEAVIRASKEYPCLYRLFREYDVRAFDPHPESHAAVQHFGEVAKATVTPGEDVDVVFEDRDCTYRENLTWAMGAAGEYLHTKQHPGLCPNYSAWFLYMQAVENPKEFLTRIGQIEAKNDESETKRALMKGGRKSVAEIDAMLEELEEERLHGEGAKLGEETEAQETEAAS